jgi:hypothetical protein
VDGSRWAGFGKITTLSVRTGKDNRTCVTMAEFDVSLNGKLPNSNKIVRDFRFLLLYE